MKTCRIHRGYLVAIWTIIAATTPCQAQESSKIDWSTLADEKLSIDFSIQGPDGNPVDGAATILFSHNYAVSLAFDPDDQNGDKRKQAVLFDLAKMSWYQETAKSWIPFASCREWERASIERTKTSLAQEANPDVRAFVEAMIDPNFQSRKSSDGSVILSNSHLSYSITPAPNVTAKQLTRFLLYDRLNAYHKAMHERKLPPTAQMAVDDYLARNLIMPKQMTSVIKTGRGQVTATTDA